MKLDDLIFDFIPIIIIVSFLLFPSVVLQISATILGKIILLGIIMYYTSEDVLYGIIACGIVILYYQSLYIEGIENVNGTVLPLPDDPAVANYKSKYCNKGVLKYKDSPVKTEMVTHVFPEIQFKYTSCNPCDSTCEYNIIENKIRAEDDTRTPKNSNEFFSWETISSAWSSKEPPVNSIGVVSEPFSFIAKSPM
jgi:hypothetical protein